MFPTLAAFGLAVLPATAFSEMYALPMIVRLPHSFTAARHVPVFGSPPTHVAVSFVDVMMTGCDAVPLTKMSASRQIARLPWSAAAR